MTPSSPRIPKHLFGDHVITLVQFGNLFCILFDLLLNVTRLFFFVKRVLAIARSKSTMKLKLAPPFNSFADVYIISFVENHYLHYFVVTVYFLPNVIGGVSSNYNTISVSLIGVSCNNQSVKS